MKLTLVDIFGPLNTYRHEYDIRTVFGALLAKPARGSSEKNYDLIIFSGICRRGRQTGLPRFAQKKSEENGANRNKLGYSRKQGNKSEENGKIGTNRDKSEQSRVTPFCRPQIRCARNPPERSSGEISGRDWRKYREISANFFADFRPSIFREMASK